MRLCCGSSLIRLFIITFIQVFGIYVFLKGFLLTRTAFEARGQIRDPWDQFPLSTPSKHQLPVINSKAPFHRAIVIVIDALRFDFAVNHKDDPGHHYINKLPILRNLLETHSQSSLLYQFRADPPTTTTQRIKGLMTGSLPTFIDAGSNFASSAVQEDHLLHHVQNRYKSIYLMGDDTWTHLYPEVFDPQNTFASDSFKMLDLDSVDNDILRHLWPLIEDENSNWNFTIAHFLGVDHCGHTHGPSHPNMARKLTEMNEVIERVLAQIDENTLLVVMGDHGMSPEGDHGGESLEELISTLFIHSKRALVHHDGYYRQLSARINNARSKRLGYNPQLITERLHYNASRYPIVAQIHLVPTLAYLLQVPIPFGNLGAIIPDIVVPEEFVDNKIRGLLYMIGQFRINALQVYSYLNHYSKTTHQLDFSPSLLNPIIKHIYVADDLLFELASQPSFIKATKDLSDLSISDLNDFQNKLEHILLEYDIFLTSSLRYCESIWARFDVGSMVIGIFLLGLGLCLSVRFMSSVYQRRSSLLLATISCFAFLIVYAIYSQLFEKMGVLDWVGSIFLTSVGLTMWGAYGKMVFSLEMFSILAIVLLQSVTLGSNSFVVWEDYSSRYVLSILTLIWFVLRGAHANTLLQLTQLAKNPILILTIVRITSIMGQCREEQFPYCQHKPDMLSFDGNLSAIYSVSLIALNFGLAIFLYKLVLKKTLAKKLCAKIVYISSFIVIFLRIAQEICQNTEKLDHFIPMSVSKYLNVYLPRLVYALCLFSTIYVLCQKSYASLQKAWSLLVIWVVLLVMLQPPSATPVLLCSPLVIYLLDVEDVPDLLLLKLTILHYYGHHLFFATGHQSTFTSLPWKAAFIGFDQMNYYGGMALVTLSTLAGYLVSWFGWFVLLQTTAKKKVWQIFYLLVLMQTIPTFLCATFVFVLRRHLMTWKIFAPRFLFQTLLSIGTHITVLLYELLTSNRK